MYQVRIEVLFDSGHRLLDYDGKCAYPHGHSYKAEVFIGADKLDELGLVIDFAEFKARVKEWVDGNWDHAFLVNSADTELLGALKRLSKSRLYVFTEENPSCEVMARVLHDVTSELCQVTPALVRVWESPNQFAEYHVGV